MHDHNNLFQQCGKTRTTVLHSVESLRREHCELIIFLNFSHFSHVDMNSRFTSYCGVIISFFTVNVFLLFIDCI